MTDHEIHNCIDEKNKETIDVLKGMINGYTTSITTLITSENQNIKHSIDQLTERVGKQNGRVGKSEDRITCLETWKSGHDGETKGVEKQKDKSWMKMINVIMALIAAGSLIFTAIKVSNTEKMVANQGIPFVKNSRGQLVALPDSTVIGFFPNDSITYTIIKNKRDR